ncbi:MAG: hypothetical protein IH618_13460 [Ignavibacteriaceae bacterium]|nr:hypothetical protein [Ignavibacteriaceae bacterium]
MKKIFILLTIIFTTTFVLAQHKTMTVYYSGGTTDVVNLTNTDSIVIFICGASKVNYSGKAYNTVLIGNQCWLKENLDIGTLIQGSQNATENEEIEKYCYNNDPNNCSIYGGLYQWQEAMQYVTSEGSRGICPEGWHIPTLAEFETLKAAVNNDGNSLKAIGQGYGNGAGTDTTGFSALLGGNRETNGTFIHIDQHGHLWSSSLENTLYVYHPYLWDDRSDISIHIGVYAGYGFGVRCIKD